MTKDKNNGKKQQTARAYPKEQTVAVATMILIVIFLAITLPIYFCVKQFTIYWFIFALIAYLAFLLPYYLSVVLAKKYHYTAAEKKKVNLNISKLIVFYWLCDLFYMSVFIHSKLWQFLFGGIILSWTFVNLWRGFLIELPNFPKTMLIPDFVICIGITIYLIFIIQDEKLQSITTNIIAAVYGGLITLVGVAWTIKNNERHRKENERKRLVPYIALSAENALGTASASSITRVQLDEIYHDGITRYYTFSIKSFNIKNISTSNIILNSILIDDKEFCFTKNVLVEQNATWQIQMTLNATFCSCSRLNSFYIVVKDIIGNKYKILCAMQVVMKNYYTTEGTVNGPIMAIPFDCCVTEISLPELMV